MMDLAAAALAWTRAGPASEFTTRQLALLAHVCDGEGPRHVRDIAGHLGVSKPVVTRAVNTMAHLGLVERSRLEEDKRCCLVGATAKGRDLRLQMASLV